ncbi:MAG: carboxypeptidase regulatory-like domain-containing protein [Planctomycetes bacterium]|nr:carboxypeptidase regulatory-like domain-containing protein [Planctomycetota bacterium]
MHYARFAGFLAVAASLSLAGCGGDGDVKTVPVSGTIKKNGQPLAGALVTFVPMNTADQLAPSSVGKTDSDGKYALRTVIDDQAGAIVGKHVVRIEMKDYEEDPSDDSEKPHRDSIPKKYNYESELQFDVPAGGSKNADFDLQIP